MYYQNKKAFVKHQTEQFLINYQKDLQIGQSDHLELWIASPGLIKQCHSIANRYSIKVVGIDGFPSLPILCEDAQGRIKRNHKKGQRTKILYFGDLTPNGWAMLSSIMMTLQQEMGLMSLVSCERCGLNPEHVEKYELPYSSPYLSPCSLRLHDPRIYSYCEIFGDIFIQLDALSPEILEIIIKEAIEGNLNMEAFKEQREIEELETNEIAVLKGEILKTVDAFTENW